ncbi:MAG: monofunctional biosynthetic peptidoglycan transglycosylase [Deltaproteobacteria bacterium]|nr:monofunctional biosynthetic peptidoglycan transglycosylase [Deltaproteobacteria bacterium]
MEKTQTKTAESPIPRWLGFLGIAIGLWWLLTVYNTVTLPNVASLKETPPVMTTFMRHATPARIHYHWVPRSAIAPALQRAVIVAEDDQFYHHPGFDWGAIKRAIEINWRRRRLAFGASTITQQLAKNLFLSPHKTPLRKIQEFLIALRLEQELSKDRILELYLNVVEWGEGIYGAEAASQHYFHRSAKTLTASQAAFLASILPNPRRYGPRGYRLTPRALSILRRM